MICCYAKHDFVAEESGCQFRVNAPADPKALKMSEIFVTTWLFAVHHDNAVQPVQATDELPLPPLLTRQFIECPPSKPKIRMIAHNGIGGGIGDCIASLDAFRRLHEEFWRRGRHLEIDILAQDGRWLSSDQVYMFMPYIHNVIPGGLPLDVYCQYDVRTDTEGYTVGLDESNAHLYDYACELMSVPTAGPHRPDMLIAEPVAREVRQEMSCLPKRRLLMNFFASSFRSIAKSHRRKLIEGYAKQGYTVCVVASERDAGEAAWACEVSHRLRDRVVDCTKISSRSLHHLAAMTGEVDIVVTPDTGLCHLSGLRGVPTVAVFYSIEPRLRIRDFPSIAPFCPDVFRTGPHWGLHKPPPPEGLKGRAMLEKLQRAYLNPEAVPGYHAIWRKVDVDEILSVVPGERCDDKIGLAPMEEDRAEGQPVPTDDSAHRPATPWADVPEDPAGRSGEGQEADAAQAAQ